MIQQILLASGGVTSASDSFNRADGALGSNWISPLSSVGANGTLAIASNVVKAVTDDTHSFAIWSANSFTNNQYTQIKIGAVTGNNWMGVCARVTVGVDLFYLAFPFGSADQIYIFNGTFNLLQSVAASPAATGDIVRLEVTGSASPITLKMYRNGVLSQTFLDTVYVKTGGNPGMGLYSPAGWNLRIDDWAGGNL